MKSPDAINGRWDHWIVWNIPLVTSIKEGELPEGSVVGINDYRSHKWGGPSPPPGTGIHRYFFRLYALDTVLDLDPQHKEHDIRKAIQNHIIEQTELIGLFGEADN